MRNNRAPTAEAQEAGNEVARHLRQLVPLTAGHGFFGNRGIPEPNLSDACIDDAVAATLNVDMGDALALSQALAELSD